jgi:hypothetical protein
MKRRDLLKIILETAALSSTFSMVGCVGGSGLKKLEKRLTSSNDQLGESKLLLVVAAAGGAAMTDAFLPIIQNGRNHDLFSYPSSMIGDVPGSEFKYVKPINTAGTLGLPDPNFDMRTFLLNHGRDMALISQNTSSANHDIAAQRVLHGDGAFRKRSIVELNANAHGEKYSLANVNLATQGYGKPGGDLALVDYAKSLRVATAQSVAFSSHRFKGVDYGLSVENMKLVKAAQQSLEQSASAHLRWKDHQDLRNWVSYRNRVEQLERNNVIDQLLFLERVGVDNSKVPVQTTPLLNKIKAAFPDYLTDAYQSQAAIAFLLLRNGISNNVTIDMSLGLSFDQAHQFHTDAQNYMWRRTLRSLDALLNLCKSEYYLGDQRNGTIWDRLVTYVPTEFGRDKKKRQGSGHDLNNSMMVLAKNIKGNRSYGELDQDTGIISGFDLSSGVADTSLHVSERHMYSILANLLEIPFPGRIKTSALI